MMKLSIVPFLMALSATIPVHAADKANEKRLDEVAQRGAHVMPFDLEKPHMFFPRQQREEYSRLSPKTNPIQNKLA